MSSDCRVTVPDEVLHKILSSVKGPKHHELNLRLVCKKFDAWFKTQIGLGLTINNNNSQILDYQRQRFALFSRLKFSDLTITFKDIFGSQANARLIVTSLEFHRITVSYNILAALVHFVSVRKLKFSCIFMEQDPKPLKSHYLALPQLRKLTLFSKTGDHSEMDFQWSNKKKFPEDEEIILNFLSACDLDVLKSVFLYCSESILESQPLQQISIPFSNDSAEGEMSSLCKLLRNNMNSLEEFYGGKRPGLYFIGIDFIKRRQLLPGFGMEMEVFNSYLDIPREWDLMFLLQNSLEVIRMNGAFRHWSAIEVLAQNCRETLNEVHLAGGGRCSSVSLEGFANCRRLLCLELHLDDCYLKNLQSLPKSLRKLCINGPVKSQDLQNIASNLKNLESFVLQQQLKYGDFYDNEYIHSVEIGGDILKNFLKLDNLKYLEFQESRVDYQPIKEYLESIITRILFEYQPIKGYRWGTLKIQVPNKLNPFHYI